MLQSHLEVSLSSSSLRLYRVLFGGLMAAALIRFWAYGWIETLYLTPSFQFHYWPWESITPTPGRWLYGVFAFGIVAALGIMTGIKFRFSMGVWLVCFVLIESLDKTLYLNHYVLMTCLGLALWCAPVHRHGPKVCPGWNLWLLRAILASVYAHAALAKVNADWLLRAEPLGTWLRARTEVPLLGWLGVWEQAPWVMSWGGLLFDLCIVPFLLWSRSRGLALVVLVGFHVVTWILFPIGMFPWVMIASSTLFLPPDWPDHVKKKLGWRPTSEEKLTEPLGDFAPLSTPTKVALCLVTLMLVFVPLRSWLYPGVVHWTEQGYRFSWKVMLNEKAGDLVYRLKNPETGQVKLILPSEELTQLQVKMMSTQPDMILEYAHHLGQRALQQTGERWEVYADAWVSWNGREASRLVDPSIDLTQQSDTLFPYLWVYPSP